MKSNQKGMTVAEVIISFAMISLSLAIGIIGIASGSRYINSGAKLKNQQRSHAEEQLQTTQDVTVTITGEDGSVSTVPAVSHASPYFVKYEPPES